MAKEVKIQVYEPTPRQLIFHEDWHRYIMYGGGLGGGKTKCLCEDANFHMLNFPGNRGFIGRAVYSDFDITTYVELIAVLKPLLDCGAVVENKTKHYFTYSNGSVLWYGGLERDTGKGSGLGKKNKLFGAEFGWIGFDQAEELTRDQFEKAASRLRRILPDGSLPPYRCALTANPSQNWIKTRFILAPDENSVFIPALASDNPHLPKDYVENLMGLFSASRDYIEALVMGSWDSISAIDDLLKMSEVEDVKMTLILDKEGNAINPLMRYYNHRVIAIDPALFGDDKTVIYGFENEFPMFKKKYGKKDPEFTVGVALMLEKQMGGNCLFVVDDTGGYGSGIVAALKATYHEDTDAEGYNPRVMAVNSCSKANDDVHYANQRSENYYLAACDIKAQRCGVPKQDIELAGQLCAHKFNFARGKLLILSKDLVKLALGGVSPDESDAYVLGLKGVRSLVDGSRVLKPKWQSQKPLWQVKREEKMLNYEEAVVDEQDLFLTQE